MFFVLFLNILMKQFLICVLARQYCIGQVRYSFSVMVSLHISQSDFSIELLSPVSFVDFYKLCLLDLLLVKQTLPLLLYLYQKLQSVYEVVYQLGILYVYLYHTNEQLKNK